MHWVYANRTWTESLKSPSLIPLAKNKTTTKHPLLFPLEAIISSGQSAYQCKSASLRTQFCFCCCSVAKLCLTLRDSMDYIQYSRLPCPLPTPGACSNSCPLSQWCHPTFSSSVIPFSSCLQCFPVSESFPLSQSFLSGGQSIGVSASASVLPMDTQDWFPLGWTALVFSNTTVQKHQFFGAQPSFWSSSHIHTWPLGWTISSRNSCCRHSLLPDLLGSLSITSNCGWDCRSPAWWFWASVSRWRWIMGVQNMFWVSYDSLDWVTVTWCGAEFWVY